MISRGIHHEESLHGIFSDADYRWSHYQTIQPKVDKLIASAKVHFFIRNKFIDQNFSKTIWERFDAVWENLTRKQKSALEIQFMSETRFSLNECAKQLKISKSSFRDRVDSAVLKFEKMFPELEGLHIQSPKPKREKKVARKTGLPRLNAPSKGTLDLWLDRVSPEPMYPEWWSDLKVRKQAKSIQEL